jgi:hypothetical protein
MPPLRRPWKRVGHYDAWHLVMLGVGGAEHRCSVPAGLDVHTTGSPKGIKSTCSRQSSEVQFRHPEGAPHSSCVKGGEDGRALAELRPVVAMRWQRQQLRR